VRLSRTGLLSKVGRGLSKNKRTVPIEWKSSDGERWVQVTANATHGMATIWDVDVLIWAVSQINAAVEAGHPTSPEITFQPYDMLKSIGRDTGGKGYAELEAALNRLAGTLIETNIRGASLRRKAGFHLLEGWEHDTDAATGHSKGVKIILPRWLYEGVATHRDVLAIAPAYFDLTSGIARWLYRLARRHAGKQAMGWRFTMKGLHDRSGSTQPLNQFAKDVRKAIAKGVPEYRLDILRGQLGDEVVSMIRDQSKIGAPRRRTLRRIEGLAADTIRSVDGHGVSPPDAHGVSPPKARGITTRKRL
jgi:plasmid replication initiation protein